jgi:AsmA protein
MLVILWIVGGLVALAVIAMVLVPLFIDEQALLDMAQEQIKANTGGELIVEGGAELSFFPRFGLRLEDTSLDLPARSEYDPSIQASIAELDVGLSLLPLLSGNVDVGTIVIAGVTADITDAAALPPAPAPAPVMSDRQWEKRGEIIRQKKEQERQRQLAEASGVTGIAILAEAVQIEDITLVQRAQNGDPRNTIKVSSLTLSDVNTRNEPMRLDGKMSVLGDGTVTPLDIAVDGAIRIASDFSHVLIEALTTELVGALTEPLVSTLNGKFVLSPAKADFSLDANLPGGDVTGSLVWSALESPEIKLDVSTVRLDVDRIQPAAQPQTANAAGTPTLDAKTPSASPNRGAPVPLPLGPLKNLDLDMRVAADELLTAGQSITDAQVLLRVQDGIANIDYIRGVLHQGQLDTRLRLNARRPVVEAEIKGGLKGVNMDSLLASLGTTDAAAGRIEISWDLETEGVSAEDLMGALDGDVKAAGEELNFKKISLQGLVCSAVAMVNKIPPITGLPTNTPISDLSLNIDFDDGAGDIERLRFATPGIVMSGSGDVDLNTMDFGFRMEGQVNNEIMQVSPLCVIDQRYAGVDWPLECSGNLASETGASCKVDVASIAEQILKNEAKQQLQDAVEEKAGSLIKKLFGG